MGADFIYAMADTTKPLVHWLNILGEFDDGQMAEFLGTAGMEWVFDDFFEDGVEDSVTYQKCAERIQEALHITYNGTRETGVALIDGKRWTLTGGMSWGDTPTEVFDDVAIADAFISFVSEREGVT